MKPASFVRLLILLFTAAIGVPAALAAPQWIWLSKEGKANEKATLRREFELAGEVKTATLSLSCDNAGKAFLNEKAVGETAAWETPFKGNVKALLRPGKNELRIDASNADGVAAVVALLAIELADGTKVAIETSADWQVAPAGSTAWQKPVVIANYGDAPWGKVFTGGGKSATASTEKAAAPESLKVPEGFKVELLYTVPKAEQGSWVTLTSDPKGRLLTSDQNGAIYRVTVPPAGQTG
jgi:hypothetical protein